MTDFTSETIEWRSVRDLVRIGFARSSMLLVNEAHSGLLRCQRTREVGHEVLDGADEAGVRRLAMEALKPGFAAEANGSRRVPAARAGYLAQPDMRALVQHALDLDWALLPYEADVAGLLDAGLDPKDIRHVNQREAEQARNLAGLSDQGGPMLVWCGNGHLTKVPVQDWRPMGFVLREQHGIEPFAVDQTRTVQWPERGASVQVDALHDQLGEHDGVAGFLSEEAPGEWKFAAAADAFVFALDNEMT